MIIDVIDNTIEDLGDITAIFPDEGVEFYLTLVKLVDYPMAFFLTGSVADGKKNPDDLDFFTQGNDECEMWLAKNGFIAISATNYGDHFVTRTFRKLFHGLSGATHIDIQSISPLKFERKHVLMRSFHSIMRVIATDLSKAQKKAILGILDK